VTLMGQTACQTLNTKKEQGAVIGAAGGAAIGAAVGKATGSTARGAIIGAAVGGAAGAIIGHQMDQKAKEIQATVAGADVKMRQRDTAAESAPQHRQGLAHIAEDQSFRRRHAIGMGRDLALACKDVSIEEQFAQVIIGAAVAEPESRTIPSISRISSAARPRQARWASRRRMKLSSRLIPPAMLLPQAGRVPAASSPRAIGGPRTARCAAGCWSSPAGAPARA